MMAPRPPRTIRLLTKRFCIRPLEKRDFKAWVDAHQAMLPRQNEFDTAVKPKSKLTKAKYLRMLKRQGDFRKRDFIYVFGVFERRSGKLVGLNFIELVIRLSQQTAWVAYNIFNNHWRKGYATESVTATIDFAFRKLKLHRLEAPIEPGNKASIAFARSMGMRKECLSRKRMYIDGRWEDLLIFVLTAEDWGIKRLKPTIGAAGK